MSLNHSFSVEHAQVYGVECAILIHHLQYWIQYNQGMGKNFHDGRTWMYQTQKEISTLYPYWSEDTVSRLMNKLVEYDVIIKGNFNKLKYDRTTWYAFKNEEKFIIPRNRGTLRADSRDGSLPLTEPIPNTKPNAKQIPVCSEPPVGVPRSEKNDSQFCEKTHIDGHKIKVSLQELIKQSIQKKKNFTLEEIREAWEIVMKCTQCIRDPWRYFEGIIEKIRNSKTYNKITKKEQDKKCQMSNHVKNNELSKKESPTIDKRVSLGLDMWGRPLAK